MLWLDCDREGENICYEVGVLEYFVSHVPLRKLLYHLLHFDEVMDNAVPHLSSAGGQQQVWRAQFSSLAPVDLKRAMATLGSPNKDMSDSVDARAEPRRLSLQGTGETLQNSHDVSFSVLQAEQAEEMDLKLGCAFTRFQTKYFQGKYGDLDTNLVSYGPCQTPTLWFCVRRSDEINSFQPESYYTIDVTISKAGRDLHLQWDRGQVFDMPIASLFMSLIQDNAKALVMEISQKEDRMARPQALNTVAMLKMASTRHGKSEGF